MVILDKVSHMYSINKLMKIFQSSGIFQDPQTKNFTA